MSFLENLHLPSFISKAIPITLAVFIILFLTLFFILSYHWRKYGVTVEMAKRFKRIYLIVGLTFLTIMIIATIVSNSGTL